ncbi:MAG TPA: DUF58 domain-containing protein [Solirubrobacterales bacterium]|jgi:uncharacterized protein (DUF58 family)
MSRALGTGVLGAALAFTAAAFSTPSLYVPGLALLGLAGLSWTWVWAAAAGATLERAPGPTRINEGDEYDLRLIPRAGPIPPPGGELHDPLLAEPVHVRALRPRPVQARLRFPRRGRHRLTGSAWVLRDPLGLCERRVEAPAGHDLIVLPRIEPVVAGPGGGAGLGMGRGVGEEGAGARLEARANEFEVDGLRPYRDGAPASRIHWPTLARVGELHERRLAVGRAAGTLVVLDAASPESEEALDQAVRAAASLGFHLARRGGCSMLLPGHRAPFELDASMRMWPTVHAQLALVAPGAPTELPSRAQRASVVWVTGGSVGRGARVARAFGPGPHFVVAPVGAVEGRSAFTVAGCTGRLVGTGRVAAEVAA